MSSELSAPICVSVFGPAAHYAKMFESFSVAPKIVVDLNGTALSEAIYFHLCKMHYAGWHHRVNFKRKRKHSMADLFHDTVAFYLRIALPEEYSIEIETKIGKIQPDILVKKQGRHHFILEIKTSIGWARDSINTEIGGRIQALSENFKVDQKNIAFIFLDHRNVSKIFSDRYWDEDRGIAKIRPNDEPYSSIFPLFNGVDPYYWKTDTGSVNKKRDSEVTPLTDAYITQKATSQIVTPFEQILKMIQA